MEWTWSGRRERDGIDQSKSYQVQKLDNGSLIPVSPISAPHSLASLRYGLLEKGSPEKRGQCSTYSLGCTPLCPKSGWWWTSEDCRSRLRLLIGVWLANRMAEKLMEEFVQGDGGEGSGPTYGIRSSFFQMNGEHLGEGNRDLFIHS